MLRCPDLDLCRKAGYYQLVVTTDNNVGPVRLGITVACASDGNGNVATSLATDGSGLTAQYEYGPFGELLRATGPMAKSNPFRFSTKYQDDETDLLYYGYRYYNPSTGRWQSRDLLCAHDLL